MRQVVGIGLLWACRRAQDREQNKPRPRLSSDGYTGWDLPHDSQICVSCLVIVLPLIYNA